MKYLCQGQERKAEILILLELTKITREELISAMLDHLVKNFSIGHAAMLNDIPQPNLTVALNSLNKVAEIVERFNELRHTT